MEFLREAVERFPERAARSARPAVLAALANGDVSDALASEQSAAMAADRGYCEPLRHELEQLRHAARRAL